ncbi:hypothetical protein ACFSHT_05875 [Paraburkholderia silviterrae]|uniref:O-antigen ligase n=1 Tax=Paraburkholderia silviterrae TaxID=2528715 RepID=A0A4R5MCL0_9BURK|nr:hypothetical protein [Paraburkholderia silviterrae]TDG24434.1 hypothetical protein EYW47_07665 [Paraburkholderia silviterrae]
MIAGDVSYVGGGGGGRKSASYYFAICAISAKLVMDFFVPAREVNFLAFNILLVILFLLFRPRIYLGTRGVFCFLAIWLFFIFQVLRGLDNSIAYKMAGLPVLVVIFYSTGRGINNAAMKKLSVYIFAEFCVFFIVNYFISLAKGLTSSREFWNFEHANLLGSYVLCMLVPVNYLIISSGRLRGRLLGLCLMIMGYLSTSTGAFLLSVGVFVRARNFRVKNILLILISGIFLAGAGIFILSVADTATYAKIVAPFRLISDGGWERLVNEARNGGGIAYLTSDQQGSFTWRVYAYLVYMFYIFNEGWNYLLFGNGVGGYEVVWGGAMPHNDFILILVDYGLLFFTAWIFFFVWLLVKVWKKYPEWFVIVILVLFRLLCENNLYSYYVASTSCIIFSLIFGATVRETRNRSCAKGKA